MDLHSVCTAAGKALALLVAGFVVFVLGATVIVPQLGGATAYTIVTASMQPSMPPGTVVVVRPTPADRIRTGDVLTYQVRSGDPTVVTHRVQSVGIGMDGEQRFTTQGDANDVADSEPVRPVQVKGVQWYSVPYVGLPALMVGRHIREVVVMGSVLVLLGYAGASFAGAFAERRLARRSRTPAAAATAEAERAMVEVAR